MLFSNHECLKTQFWFNAKALANVYWGICTLAIRQSVRVYDSAPAFKCKMTTNHSNLHHFPTTLVE